jgi:hypothetical protein
MRNLLKSCSIISFLVLTQCGSTTPTPTPSITLTVDGTSKVAIITSGLLLVETTGNKGRTLGINALEMSNILILDISNWDFQKPPADGVITKTYYNVLNPKSTCTQVSSATLCDGGLVTYLVGSEFYSSVFYDGPAYESTIKVTSNDVAAKRISGDYDVKVQSSTGSRLTLKGKFDNVTYIKQ